MIPKTTGKFQTFATSLANGLETHGLWLGVGDESIRAVRARLNNLERTREALVTARNTKTFAIKRLGLADKHLKSWLGKARLVVMLARGARWSRALVDTGFTSPAMRVPKKLDGRVSLARALVSFFARHPEFGVGFADITAARGRAIYERAIQSREMLELAKNDCEIAARHRDLAEGELRDISRIVVNWLRSNLDRADARWAELGFATTPSRKAVRRSRRVDAKPIEFVPPSEQPSHSVAAA